MTKITYEEKMEYLEKRRQWLKGTLDMILRLHPEGDHRTQDLQHKLDIIKCMMEDLEVLEILKSYLIIGKDKYGEGTWGWVEINLDLIKNPVSIEVEENEEKLKIQRWLNNERKS